MSVPTVSPKGRFSRPVLVVLRGVLSGAVVSHPRAEAKGLSARAFAPGDRGDVFWGVKGHAGSPACGSLHPECESQAASRVVYRLCGQNKELLFIVLYFTALSACFPIDASRPLLPAPARIQDLIHRSQPARPDLLLVAPTIALPEHSL